MASNKFSGILQLSDLDDFIAPSQECIKPLKLAKNVLNTGSKVKVEEEIHEKTDADSILPRIDISLNDCLACSGCITSAETVLITKQSHEEISRVLRENNLSLDNGQESKFVVLSLSIQPVLSLAARFNLSPEDTVSKITGYFKEKGVHAVHTTTIAEDLTLSETVAEFIFRYENKKNGLQPSMPMFASACPGWICYAEKTHEFVLPFISTAKSPQQIMGSLVKSYYAKENGIKPSSIYHFTLMPCYDKKLEASREDFFNADLNVRDIDCVITAVEMELLLQKENVNLSAIKPQCLDSFRGLDTSLQEKLYVHPGSMSGGYAYYVFANAAQVLFAKKATDTEFKTVKNQDLKEIKLQNGDAVLTFAIVNGFRNIQNMIQKMKRNKIHYDYVEVMACPSGCINGSAQVKPQSWCSTKELIQKLENLYNQTLKRDIIDYKLINELYNEWLKNVFENNLKSALHTSYHPVPKSTVPLNIKW